MNWRRVFKARRRLEKELDAELRDHFERQVADKVRAGMTAEEARRSTRLEFGGLDQIKEEPAFGRQRRLKPRRQPGLAASQGVWQSL